MELITNKPMTEQYIRQSIHEIKTKIKTAHKDCNVKIIEMRNHRYLLNKKIDLDIHRNM